jgi:hypothetical protein
MAFIKKRHGGFSGTDDQVLIRSREVSKPDQFHVK